MSHGSHRNLVEFNSVDYTGRGGIFCSDDSNYNIISNNVITRVSNKPYGGYIDSGSAEMYPSNIL